MNDDMNISNIPHHEVGVPIPDTAEQSAPEEYLSEIPDYDDNFTIEEIQKLLGKEETIVRIKAAIEKLS